MPAPLFESGGQRVAMNRAGVVYYVLGDHLGSTAITVDSSGAKVSELRYKPYGEVRYSGLPAGTGTDYRFTGQRQLAGAGLYHMGARWIDPALGRWLSADTLVPEPANPQGLNRYSFVLGNPCKYVDPSGHYHQDVHYDLTRDLTFKIAWKIAIDRGLSVDEANKVANQLARGIAGANQWADQEPFNLSAMPGTNHWKSHKQAREDMEEAVHQASVMSLGYSLHAVQDSFAHFGQGFIAETGVQGMNRWRHLFSEDDRFSITGENLEEMNPFPTELREQFASDWGHFAHTLLGMDPDKFDEADPWDQMMVAETEYYLWEFLLFWFEWHYGELPAEGSSNE